MAGLREEEEPPWILLVGESTDECDMYAAGFRLCGFRTLQATSIEGAERLAAGMVPGAIVADVGRCGYQTAGEMIHQLRTSHPGIHVPVVILASYEASGDTWTARDGCECVLMKPCSPYELTRVVAELVGPTSTGASH